jgi:hypothetical protein
MMLQLLHAKSGRGWCPAGAALATGAAATAMPAAAAATSTALMILLPMFSFPGRHGDGQVLGHR